jgi:hypothetical protein
MSFRAFPLLALGVAAVAVTGCSGTAPVSTPTPPVGSDVIIANPVEVEEDAGALPEAAAPAHPPASGIFGSQLCNATQWMGCYPDNVHAPSASDCPNGPMNGSDGSSGNAGGSDSTSLGCRVQPTDADAGVAPVCAPAGSSTEGMSCAASTDCAPGYECVGDGRCRAYCCAGECTNDSDFCDIQTSVTYPTIKVPVCMPISPCGLLDGGACAADETCAVVRETGATGCVTVGPKQAGEECNTDHCARGLVCLGTAGERSCYILCHTTGKAPECDASSKQTCKGGIPLFPTPGIGICQ